MIKRPQTSLCTILKLKQNTMLISRFMKLNFPVRQIVPVRQMLSIFYEYISYITIAIQINTSFAVLMLIGGR